MKKGNTMFTTAIVIAVVIIGLALVWSRQSQNPSSSSPTNPPNNQIMNGERGINENDAIENAQNELLNKTNDTIYQGDLISGISAPYLVFTKVDYDQALLEGKIIFLDFYANWCPICRAEAPELIAGFNELSTDQIVGFRVNYKDDETDVDEKALAEQFDIPYQHTKVILVNGQEVSRSGESWDKEKFIEEINKVL